MQLLLRHRSIPTAVGGHVTRQEIGFRTHKSQTRSNRPLPRSRLLHEGKYVCDYLNCLHIVKEWDDDDLESMLTGHAIT
jgi:hypothetical protein